MPTAGLLAELFGSINENVNFFNISKRIKVSLKISLRLAHVLNYKFQCILCVLTLGFVLIAALKRIQLDRLPR